MSIAAETRERDVAVQRRWYDMTGPDQRHLPGRDVDQERWKGFAQCGPFFEDPDPDTFFPIEADSEQTYAAQAVCGRCVVRRECDAWATERGMTGVWGGIFRDQTGRFAPLCQGIGCLRYRAHGKAFCRSCYSAEVAAERDRKARDMEAAGREALAEPAEAVAAA